MTRASHLAAASLDRQAVGQGVGCGAEEIGDVAIERFVRLRLDRPLILRIRREGERTCSFARWRSFGGRPIPGFSLPWHEGIVRQSTADDNDEPSPV